MFVAKFIRGHERILIRTDVVIAIRPILDPAPAIETRFWRQGRPANVILARTPRNPGRRPFLSRHPNPADAAQPHPPAIVISCPAEGLIRDPRPTGIAINPVAFRVGPPIARVLGVARLEHIAVLLRFSPFAVGIELFVKHSVGRRGTRFGTITSFGDNFFRWRSGGRFFEHRRRARRRGGFSISQCFLARVQFGLLFRDLFLVRRRLFHGESFLHLAFDFGFSFLFGLLFLTGNKKRQGCDQRENEILLHDVIRPFTSWVIRISRVEMGILSAILKWE